MTQLTVDALYMVAMYLDYPELLAYCKSDPYVNRNLCLKDSIWLYRLDQDYPNWKEFNINKNPRDTYLSIHDLDVGIILRNLPNWKSGHYDPPHHNAHYFFNNRIPTDWIIYYQMRTKLENVLLREDLDILVEAMQLFTYALCTSDTNTWKNLVVCLEILAYPFIIILSGEAISALFTYWRNCEYMDPILKINLWHNPDLKQLYPSVDFLPVPEDYKVIRFFSSPIVVPK